MLGKYSTIVLSIIILINLSQGERYGESCADVGPVMGQQCESQFILTCRNGSCACVYEWMIYDELHGVCLSPAGKHCGLDHNYWLLDCIENASCDLLEEKTTNAPQPPSPMICKCKDGFIPQTKKSCHDDHFLPNGTAPSSYNPAICCPA